MADTAPPLLLRFGPFLLEEANARLSSDGRVIEIVPKAFGVLCHLAARPGQLVTKDELLDAVWGHRFVSESVLKSAVKTIRACLGDAAQAPRYVETVHRRGYRFIGMAALPPVALPALAAAGSSLVGRQREMALLAGAWQHACAGQRRLVLLAGEPGIGKSCLTDHFAASVDSAARVGRGQCVDQVGGDAAYLPVLEALAQWCAEDPSLPALLRQVAPTWLLQMPWQLQPQERAALQRELAGAGPERMLREITELLDRVAAQRPVLLVLEDLHWSDAATVRLLDVLARRRGSARIMVLGTFRPGDMLLAEHPLADLRRELRLHGLCEELLLAGLDRSAIEACLARRLGADPIDAALVAALQRHTEGHPLFLARVVDELSAAALLRNARGRWSLDPAHSEALPIPLQLAEVIERQALRLPAHERELLQAAALCPTEFEAPVLAAALAIPVDAASAALTKLSRQAVWLRRAAGTGGDGADARFAFSHALYRHVLRAQLPARGRVALHRALGAALEAAHPDRLAGHAAELGLHAEQGEQPGRAAVFLSMAAAQAMRRFSPRHALALAERALALLDKAAPTAPAGLATTLHSQRLLALVATNGYAAPPTLSAAREAEAAIEGAEILPPALPIWYGCAWIELYTGHADRALALALTLQERTAHAPPGLAQALSLTLQGVVAYHGNRFVDSRLHLARAVPLLEAMPAGFEAAYFPQSPLLEALAHLGHAQELLGDFGPAARSREQLAALVDSGMHPLGEAMGLWFLAYAHHLRGEPEHSVRLCEVALQKMSGHDVNPGKGMHLSLLAWACGRTGRAGRATELAHAALHEQSMQRTRLGHGTLLTCLGGAFLSAGEWDAARAQLDAALHAAQDPHNRFGVSETHRLLGEVCWRQGDDPVAARDHFEQAIHLARDQHAGLLELLARDSQAGMWDALGRPLEAAASLAGARALLASTDGAPPLPDLHARQAARAGLRRAR